MEVVSVPQIDPIEARQKRERAGLPRSKFSRKCRVNEQTLYLWEVGRVHPNNENAIAWAAALAEIDEVSASG
jgi:DNA-binding transcriptional regulator YiaG